MPRAIGYLQNQWTVTILPGEDLKHSKNALKQIHQPMLVIGIDSDILCPVPEQNFLAENIPNSSLHIISSDYGTMDF
jgi:homoserine acetyltransferase